MSRTAREGSLRGVRRGPKQKGKRQPQLRRRRGLAPGGPGRNKADPEASTKKKSTASLAMTKNDLSGAARLAALPSRSLSPDAQGMHKALHEPGVIMGSWGHHGVVLGVMAQCDLVHHVEPRADILLQVALKWFRRKHERGHKHATTLPETTTQDCHHVPHPNKKRRPQAGTEAQDKENKTNRGRPDVGHQLPWSRPGASGIQGNY